MPSNFYSNTVIFIFGFVLGKEEVKTLSQKIISMVQEWIRYYFLP